MTFDSRDLTRRWNTVRRLDLVDGGEGWADTDDLAPLSALELMIVVDDTPSMTAWRPTVARAVALAKRCGLFRSVVELRLTGPGPPVLRSGAGRLLSSDLVLAGDHPRAVLVLSDGVAPWWRSGRMSTILAQWAAAAPVLISHLLPVDLWQRSGLRVRRGAVGQLDSAMPNAQWTVRWTENEADSRIDAASAAVAIPVAPFQSAALRTWATRLARGAERADGAFYLAGLRLPDPVIEPEVPSELHGEHAEEVVARLRSTTSPTAFRLATMLAAVPLTLRTAWLVQGALLPESDPRHLAEILVSGATEPVGADAPAEADGAITIEIRPDIRRQLLRGVPRSDTARAAGIVAQALRERMPAWRHVGWALEEPDRADEPEITEMTRPFVVIEAVLLEVLGGPYAGRARRLRASLDAATQPLTTNHDESSLKPFDNLNRDEDRGDTMGSELRGHITSASVTGESIAPDLSAPLPVSPSADLGERPRRRSDGAAPALPLPPAGLPRSETLGTSEALPPIFGLVPPRNPNFTGRTELLAALGERLAAGGATAVLPEALHGLGGVGKTLIVVEYIYLHLQDFDVIWWIPAASRAQIQAALVELAQRLGLPVGTEANTAVRAVLDSLRKGIPHTQWLLVFDNAEDPRTVEEFLPPTSGPGRVVVTSRNPSWGQWARPLEVDLFTRAESKQLLRKRGPEITDEEADELAALLGDLPLALEQAAAWRAETGMPVAEYLRMFAEKSADLLADEDSTDDDAADNRPPYARSVSVAWKVSLDALRERNPAALELLQLASFLAPDGISRQYFTDVQNVHVGADHLDAALRDPVAIGRAIRALTRYSLVKLDYRANSLQVHRLVQQVVINEMSEEQRARMRHGVHQLLARAAPNDPATARNWSEFQKILPHAYASRIVECEEPWVRQLVINMMWFLYWWGSHDAATELAREAHNLWSARMGETDQQTLAAANCLGFVLRAVGRYGEAAEVNRRTLELRRELEAESSGGVEEVLDAINQVAWDLRTAGDFRGALALDEEAYQTAVRQFGDDDSTTLLTAHNLGVDLRQTGQYRRALELDQDTYRRRAELLGADDEHTIGTLHSVIADRREGGDYVGARASQEEATKRALELSGDRKDAPTTLRRVLHLSVAQRKDGDHQSALELSTDVWKQFQQRYGDDHPQTMNAALTRSIDLRQTGDLHAAGELGEATYRRYRQNLGEDHPHTAAAAVDLSVTRRLLGDPVAARQLNERAHNQLVDRLGEDHPYVIVCAVNLASDLAAAGLIDAALEIGVETVARARRVLGPEHPSTLAVELNRAFDQRAAGQRAEAETHLIDLMDRFNEVLGAQHPATISAAQGIRANCDIDVLPL